MFFSAYSITVFCKRFQDFKFVVKPMFFHFTQRVHGKVIKIKFFIFWSIFSVFSWMWFVVHKLNDTFNCNNCSPSKRNKSSKISLLTVKNAYCFKYKSTKNTIKIAVTCADDHNSPVVNLKIKQKNPLV